MGANVWRTGDDRPPPDAVSSAFYLHSAGKSNTRGGDGKLTRLAPATAEPADSFESNPDHPDTLGTRRCAAAFPLDALAPRGSQQD